MKRLLVAAIRSYQATVSPDHGWWRSDRRLCRFEPTCSEYAVTAIEEYGSITGIALAVRRIARCHPWHPGGVDPVIIKPRRPDYD